MKALTLEECSAIVHADPNGEGSLPGLLQKLSQLDERVCNLESGPSKKAKAPKAPKAAKAPKAKAAPDAKK